MKRNTLLKWCLVMLAALMVLGSVTLIGFAQESTEQNAPTPTLDIKTFSLSLENAVFMNFKVANENVSDPASIQLLAWDESPAEYKKGTEDLCLSANTVDTNTGYSIFQYTDLAAKDMTKMVYVCAYVNEDGVEAYSEPAKFSIAMYAYLKKNATNPDTDLCALLDSMLAYGAQAQLYFDHNTDLLATDTIHQIKVTNGTLPDGFALGWYKENTTVTLTANAPADGYMFSHWTNSADETVGTEETITVDVTKAETYTANYKEAVTYSTGLEFTSNGDGTCYVSDIGTCSDTDINIPPFSPEGWSVTGIGTYSFQYCTNLTSITIPDSVVTIGANAFDYCKNVTSITIPNSVTSIGQNAFDSCTSLTSIAIPGKVTSIGSYAFRDCTSLTNIDFPDNATLIHINKYTFSDCQSLTSITIPNNVTGIGEGAFDGCTSLMNINIPDNVISIGQSAFNSCASLTSITIPDSVITIDDTAFSFCTGLTSITIPNSVASIGKGVFSGCRSLESIVVSDGNTIYHSNGNCLIESASRTLIAGCKKSIIPIDGSVTSINDMAFYSCSSLTSITIPVSVTSIGDSAFSYCSSLTSITIPDSVTSIGDSAFSYCSNLTSITIPDSVTNIGNFAFYGCSNLRTVYYTGKVTDWAGISIGSSNNLLTSATLYYYSETQPTDTTYQYWHYVDGVPTVWEPVIYSTGLEFTSNGDGTCYVSDIGTCTDSVINIPPVSPEGWTVTGIGYEAFRACSNLTSITIPEGVTSIGNNAFQSCDKLVEVINHSDLSITVGSFDNGLVAHSAKEVHTGNTKILNQNDYLFYTYNGVNYLLGYVGADTELTLPSTYYGQNYEIYQYAFRYCSNLTSITIGNSVTSIGDYAFSSCSNLTSVTFGENSQLTSIGSYAFYYCASLKQITIPQSVTRIGKMVFYESGLSSISISGSWYCSSSPSTGGTLTTPTASNLKNTKYNLYWYKT